MLTQPKALLLLEIERELGLSQRAAGYNPGNGTLSTETLEAILKGIRRLKRE